MAKTFQDLEREVAGLRRQIRRLEGNPDVANEQAVNELTDAAYEDPSLRVEGSGMARLGDAVRQQQHDQVFERARSFARANGDLPAFQLRQQLVKLYGLSEADENRIVREVRGDE